MDITGSVRLPSFTVSKPVAQTLHSAFVHAFDGFFKDVKQAAETATPVRKGVLRAGYQIVHVGRFPTLRSGIRNPVPHFKFVEEGHKIPFPQAGGQRVRRIKGVWMLRNSIQARKQRIRQTEKQLTAAVARLI